jgi:hypothetical protein
MAASARTGLSRPVRLALILLAVVVFVAISFGLARILSASGAERSAVVNLVEAEAHGDLAAVVRRIDDCAASQACRAGAARNVARLRRTGDVQILNFAASTGFGIANTHGRARVAWRVPGRAPVVQCVDVRRKGNPITGLTVHLLALSAPIRSDASCP